jgi:pimeloyl-ACP methyl ester carboxylesterase
MDTGQTEEALLADEKELYFLSINSEASETIIFLHGICSSHVEFLQVASHLTGYHLLLVDLPSHSGSRDIKPFRLTSTVEHVAALIRRHAHGGRAHVVGLSLGGFIGLRLATEVPDVVSSLWVTGATPFTDWQIWFCQHPRLLYIVFAMFTKWLPDTVHDVICKMSGMPTLQEVRPVLKSNLTQDLISDGYGELAKVSMDNTVNSLA